MSQVTDRFARIKPGLDAIPPESRSLEQGVLEETRRFRGITLEQAARYLNNLGGTRVNDRQITGDGWRAELSAHRDPIGPSYRLTTVTVTWRGDPGALEPVIYGFRLKAFRAPG